MSLEEGRAQLILELRRAGTIDKRTMEAMESVPRELFVPDAIRDKAYENIALPIGHHQTISQPQTVGLMTQALDVGERMKVLEIGTGSGYQSAVLAPLCRRLYSVERFRELLAGAEDRFTRLRLTNITTRCGDGSLGWPEQAPFDRIIVTAAAHDIPTILVEQLVVGGIMVLPLNDGHHENDQRLIRVIRNAKGVETEDLGMTRFVPLVEGDRP